MATALVAAVFAYAALGAIVAVPMAARGINRFSPAAADGTWGFRLLAMPGIVALWPLVLARWARAKPS